MKNTFSIHSLLDEACHFFGLKSILYFLFLGMPLSVVYRSQKLLEIQTGHWLLFLLRCFATISLGVTWFYIIRFLVTQQAKLAKMTPEEALEAPNLFLLAYEMVCDNSFKWFWSSHLLTLSIPMHLYLYLESFKVQLTQTVTVSYILVGLLGAQSFAFSLFFLHTLAIPQKIIRNDANIQFTNSTLFFHCVALFSIVVIGMDCDAKVANFRNALGTLHILLLLPPILGTAYSINAIGNRKNIWTFKIVAVGCLLYHIFFVLPSCIHSNWNLSSFLVVIWENDCQTSITLDSIFMCFISALILKNNMRLSWIKTVFLFLLMPVLSPGAVFSWMYALVLNSQLQEEKENRAQNKYK